MAEHEDSEGSGLTTIAAKVTGDKVRIAWDSQVTSGGSKSYGINKVVKINGQFAVGVAGHLRYANIVHRATVNKIHPYDLTQPDFNGYEWLLDELVPAWMKALRKEGENLPDEDFDLPWGHGLIALAGHVYTIGADFSVNHVDNFASIGSGAPYAITAMHLGKSAKQAVEIATELDMFSGGTVKEMVV